MSFFTIRVKHLAPTNVVDNVGRMLITVEEELSLRVYFSLDPNETERYNNPWQGWEQIIDRFPDTVRDIEEMNKQLQCSTRCTSRNGVR
jgi:hypothetical protein